MAKAKGTSKKPIRLAIIKCDTHSYWYAPFMVPCDPMKLRERRNYVHCFIANFGRPEQYFVPRISGFKLVNVWDYCQKTAERYCDTFPDNPKACATVEEATEGVDAAMIPCCSLDGSDHLELARPFIKKRIPIFIDKPFAVSLKDAKAIIRLALKYKTPVMSTSLLTYCDEVEWLRKRVATELRDPRLAIIHGHPGWRTKSGLEGISHGVALAFATFGHGVESVECMGRLPLEYMLLHYPDGRQAMVMNTPRPGGYFYSRVYGSVGNPNTPIKSDIESMGIGDPQFIKAGPKIVKDFKKMIQTGKPPIPYENIIEWCQVIEMARKSQETGKLVKLRPITI